MRIRRSIHQHGFTLIEILLALSILVIGLVGILALFPIGIESSRAAVEYSQTAMLAESVENALVQGFRSSSGTTVQVTHDGIGNNMYFTLPSSSTVDVPTESTADSQTKTRHVFLVGGKISGTYANNIKSASASSEDVDFDPYHQYSFRFMIQKDTQSLSVNTLYLVHIYIYRNYNKDYYNKDVTRDGNHTGDWSSKSVPVSLVSSFVTLIASN